MRTALGVMFALSMGLAATAAAAQEAPQPAPAQAEATALEDVVVTGRLEEQVRRFTEGASNPVPSRGLARWRGPVCIGVYNFQREAGQQIADGLVQAGEALNVPIKDGPCDPNIMIIGAVDSRAVAAQWVRQEYREFRPNIARAALSREKLEYFTTADVPVRWWAISRPAYFDIFTGGRVLTNGPGRAPIQIRTAMNRDLHTRDDLQRLIIILDADRVANVSAENLIAYLTIISFTQIDMQAELGDFSTILNLFRTGHVASGLTDWDEAYVRGLYDVSRDLRIEPELQSARMVERLRTVASAE
jgi:hypothetical protein